MNDTPQNVQSESTVEERKLLTVPVNPTRSQKARAKLIGFGFRSASEGIRAFIDAVADDKLVYTDGRFQSQQN